MGPGKGKYRFLEHHSVPIGAIHAGMAGAPVPGMGFAGTCYRDVKGLKEKA